MTDYGKIAYDTYRYFSKGKSLISGATLLPWEELKQEIKFVWTQTADAVRYTMMKDTIESEQEVKESQCKHRFVHFSTKNMSSKGEYQTRYTRIDLFFCIKCLEQREVKKEEASREAPSWW